MSEFRFKQFSVKNEASAMKVGTDAVLLGAAMTLRPSDRSLLDIGTGTGVIALMAAQRLASIQSDAVFQIEAIDIDPASAAEAAENFASSPWSAHFRARCTPLSHYCADGFDVIFSNPPYYDSSLKNPDARESAARHTETLSYRELCAFAEAHLNPDGRLSLILPADCEKDLLRTAASFGLYPFRLLRIRTTPAKPVSRLIAEFSRTRTRPETTELTLMDPAGTRSPEYVSLTEGFYL